MAAWVAWWASSLFQHELLGGKYTWIHVPVFGADFYSQSDLAARLWAMGVDPYASRGHLFHYPPLVVWLFSWTPLFLPRAALTIWVVFCTLLIGAGVFVALRVRRALRLEAIPPSLAIAAVLFSFPVVFQLERANFDLWTLAAMLVAFPLFARRTPRAEFLAGCLLAVGPWVKLYPGIMGIGLVATRRWRAVAGFIVGGILIPLAAPTDTMRSFETLSIAVERVKNVSVLDPYVPWSHSLSVAWLKVGQALASTPFGKAMLAVPGDAFAAAFVLGLGGWISFKLYRVRGSEVVLYPHLLWLNALGSCVGAIANDYSLIFLPMAILAVTSWRDPWFVRVSMALLVLWWQPIDIGIPALPFLVIKMLGLIAVGVSIVRRAREMCGSAVPASP
ncbi:MAG TPA: glycosyltransferase family 87 protein, partial [Polyangiaceae bacterium]|nr:glycosyltransferase family 87 protein [Polyangiaceae bacterium]